MLVLLVRTKTLAVVFGPETVGVMAVIDKLLAVIAQTACLSLPFAAARFLPEQWTAGPAAYRDLFTRMRNVLLATSLVATASAITLTWVHPGVWGEALLPYRDVLLVALLGLPVVALMPFLQNAFAGRLQQNRSMVAGLAHAVVLALAVTGIAWSGLAGFYAAYALMGTILVAFVTRAALSGTQASPAPASVPGRRAHSMFGLPGQIWRFAGALLVLSILVPYSALFVHYQVLSLHGAQAAGWMQAAIGISLAVRAVLGSAHAAFLTPNVNRGGSPAERMEWANRFERTFCLLTGLAVPPILLFPDLAVRILFSSEFAPGSTFLLIFVMAEVLGLLSGTYQTLVVAFDRLRFHVISNLVAQLLVVATAFALVAPLGLLGAGLAAFAAPLFLIVATMTFLGHSYNLVVPRSVVVRSAWLATGLLSAGFVGIAMRDLTWGVVAIKAVVYLAIAAGFALLLTASEREKVREILNAWKSKWK